MQTMIKERIETHRKHLTHAMSEIGEALKYYKLVSKHIDYPYLIEHARLMIENLVILDEYQRLEYSCKENNNNNG